MKVSTCAVVAIVVVNLLGAAAAADEAMPRNVKTRYLAGGYNYFAGSSSDGLSYNALAPVKFKVSRSERWVSIQLDDSTGRAVPAQVGQDVDRDGAIDESWDVCGSTETPVAIQPGTPLLVLPLQDVCGQTGTPATSGTIYVQLHSPGRAPRVGPAEKVVRTETLRFTGSYYERSDGAFGTGSPSFRRLPGENYVTVESTDATGLPVLITLYPDTGPEISVCGHTSEAVVLPPGQEVRVYFSTGTCADGSPAAATTGEITLTFSNKP